MDNNTARLLVQNLLERLEADAKSTSPVFGALVGRVEREAIWALIGSEPSILDSGESTILPQPAASIHPPAPVKAVTLDLTCVTAIPPTDHVACIDFGTAKSKAFASRLPEFPDSDLEGTQLIELGVGVLDDDPDPYAVMSTVWISNAGRMYAGNRALRLSMAYIDGVPRERFDSIKRQLIDAYDDRDRGAPLRPSINPTDVPLTYEEAICFFLAFFVDLVGIALSEKGLSRYTPKRFTVPAWSSIKRQWAVATLGSYLQRAHIIADTFRDRWEDGIPVAEFKAALEQIKCLDTDLAHLLDREMEKYKLGISEPVAAGTGRLLTDKGLRNLVLIVDVGAGTTDFAMFRVTPHQGSNKFIPVVDSVAKARAGDAVDEYLAEFTLDKAGQTNRHTRDQLKAQMIRRGLRLDKERLLQDAIRDVEYSEGHYVTVTLVEFLEYAPLVAFAKALEDDLANFLRGIEASYSIVAETPTVLFTGGGANLPFIQSFRNRRWIIAGKEARLRTPTKPLPELFEPLGLQVYQQLAVAIGGCLNAIDEGAIEHAYPGGTIPLGPLSRTQISGT